MKKLMMIVALMATMLSANAQYAPGTFSLNVKAGINIASLTNAEKMPIMNNVTLDKQPMGGGLVGVETEYQLTKMLGLTAGVHLSEQGQGWENYKGNYNGVKTEIKENQIEMWYVNVPIVANIYLYKGLAIKAGVQFGFLTDAEMQFRIESKEDFFGDGVMRDVTQFNESKMKDMLKKVDISIPIGLSYEFRSHLVLDARYNLGLTKVNKESSPGEKDSKNSVFNVSLAYKIKL